MVLVLLLWILIYGADYLYFGLFGISALTFWLVAFGLYGLSWINIINEWERRPVLLFGKYVKTAGPGLAFIEPFFYTILDDVPVQDVVQKIEAPRAQTKNNVNVALEGIFVSRIDSEHVKKVVVEVQNYKAALIDRAHATLIDMVAKRDLTELLQDRDAFAKAVLDELARRVSGWGITISAFEITSFKIVDEQIEQSLAMQARAEQEGQAEIVRAGLQQRVAVALKDAANVYDAAAWRLKEMEVLIELCRSAQNNTIMLPTALTDGIASLRKSMES